MTKVTTFMLPDAVHLRLKQVAKESNTSMSWLIVESLLMRPEFKMTQEELNREKGVTLPKTFKERRTNKNWKRSGTNG